jgi:hypothetical protein
MGVGWRSQTETAPNLQWFVFELNYQRKTKELARKLEGLCFFIESNPRFATIKGDQFKETWRLTSGKYIVVAKPKHPHFNRRKPRGVQPRGKRDSKRAIYKLIENWKDLIKMIWGPLLGK